DRREAPERSADQSAEIVTGHVLHDVAARLDQASVGGRELNPDQQIAARAVTVPQRPALVGGNGAADRRLLERRLERQPLTVPRQLAIHIAHGRRPLPPRAYI